MQHLYRPNIGVNGVTFLLGNASQPAVQQPVAQLCGFYGYYVFYSGIQQVGRNIHHLIILMIAYSFLRCRPHVLYTYHLVEPVPLESRHRLKGLIFIESA